MRPASIDDIVSLFHRWGTTNYDEEISQLAHALQTAALAASDGASEALVAGALLHDVGHLLQLEVTGDSGGLPADDRRHEVIGASYLAALFPAALTDPVAHHVRAKRYLCAVEPSYLAKLSAGSKSSLARQGGPMGAEEVASFQAAAGFGDAVLLRRWDDEAKVDNLVVAPLDHYLGLLERVSADPGYRRGRLVDRCPSGSTRPMANPTSRRPWA